MADVEQVKNQINKDERINDLKLKKEDYDFFHSLNLINSKPMLYICNVDEKSITSGNHFSDLVKEKAKKEKGNSDNRSFITELNEMIYNVGLEYWYTDNFVLRAGYIHDREGKIMNPTFGAGIKFGQYAFDFGYTAGDKGHPRENTMYFSLSLGL